MELFETATVVPIVIICYLVGMACKASDKVSDRVIPVVCMIVGMLIAIPAMYVMSEFPADDFITAMSVGIVSGLASTGVHQVFKQIGKDE